MLSDSPILEVEGLKKYFKTPKGMLHAVDNVTFSVRPGKTLGVVGESGCGKSTTGRAILRLIEPTAGSVRFEGQDILALNKEEMRRMRQKMQIIFQDPYSSIDPRMTISDIIEEPLKLHKLCGSRKEREDRVDRMMETVGIASRLVNSYPHELDGGRRQRVGIARALILNPSFVVCDEPVSALDVSIQAQILTLMQDLQEKYHLTYMFITHNLSVVNHLADDIAVMYLGQIVEKAPAVELFEHPQHPYTKALLSAIPIPNIRKKQEAQPIKGEISSPVEPPDECRFAARCPYASERCRQAAPQLRDLGNEHFAACCLFEIGRAHV